MDPVMSKRLRASVRANNKGRSLRPKAAQLRGSSPSVSPAGGERISSEQRDSGDALTSSRQSDAERSAGRDSGEERISDTRRERTDVELASAEATPVDAMQPEVAEPAP